MDRQRSSAGLIALALVTASACREEPEPAPAYDLEALQDPQTCAECHPDHYREWLGSMHAYAADDPVFVAMNARGQRETEGELGDFCVRCHAPAAVALGLTEDGLNLAELPQRHRGVTCWFCHQADGIDGTHNNPLMLAFDGLMRADVPAPLEPQVHGVARSELFSRDSLASAKMCGSCHDIVTPAGAHIERTYAEWLASFYSDARPDDPDRPQLYALTCNDCHMRRSTGPIAEFPGVRGDRDRHSHMFVGVDVAITDFPDAELGPQLRAEQRAAIEEVRKTSLCASLCVREEPDGAELTVWLHNEAAGHSWPSGATPDRRAWVELIARDAAGEPLFESGVLEPNQAIAELDDPWLWLLRDRLFDAEGHETHMFWEAASYESELLPVPDTFGASGHQATWMSRSYPLSTMPERVTMRVLLRAMGREILVDLVESGDLDPALLDAFETFEVPPASLEWTAAEATPSTGEVDYGSCVSSSPGCASPFI
ncbi:MAG: multiheme c-type cytochrome [Enhygromyxa sp.]